MILYDYINSGDIWEATVGTACNVINLRALYCHFRALF
jgi:hypothetical protein